MEPDLIDRSSASRSPERGVFLAALCVCTWIGSALAVAQHLYTYFYYSEIFSAWEPIGARMFPEFRWIIACAMAGFSGAIVCSLGSLAMWHGRKAGFYIYAVGQLVPMLMSLYSFFFVMSEEMQLRPETLLNAGWTVVPVAFTIFYALNLKHMR